MPEFDCSDLAGSHPHYRDLVTKARRSHAEGRSTWSISEEDVARSRLYAYAFRRHTIGLFHATRVALEEAGGPRSPRARDFRHRTMISLADLGNLAIDRIPHDFRALIGFLYRYDCWSGRVVEALDAELELEPDATVARIRDRFVEVIDATRRSPGIELTRDGESPPQGGFIVPGVGVTIVPLVYGDFHSWNFAWLGERAPYDVLAHVHQSGVEIHLGFGPLRGALVLGDCRATTEEGYALPIPPGVRHGYINRSDREHHVPFIFGSLIHGGWGVFLDVEPRPTTLDDLTERPLQSRHLNHAVHLERELDKLRTGHGNRHVTLIPAARTDRAGSGGLELRAGRVAAGPKQLRDRDHFLAVSVVSGQGRLVMAGIAVELGPRDHFPVPAGIPAELTAAGPEPLVFMDAAIKRA